MDSELHIIGVISDTHGKLRPEAVAELQGVERIIHAGDVDRPEILDALGEVAPVHAVRGNVDYGDWAEALPVTEVVEVGSVSICVIHDIDRLELDPVASGFALVIYGHSHRPSIEEKRGVLFLNPGSAGPRRFELPATVARLEIEGSSVRAELVDLAV